MWNNTPGIFLIDLQTSIGSLFSARYCKAMLGTCNSNS